MIISLMFLSNALIISSFTDGEPSTVLSRGPLDAITIDSDAELIDMASDRNWTGNGTEGDPIVISDLTIDTSGGYYGMSIWDTTLHIVIENCSFFNSTDGSPHSFSSSGLILFNVISVVVTNSTFSYNTNGMTIGGCMNVEVRNSSFLRNLRGIEMILSNNSRILGCTLDENTRDGIFIETSEMCIVQGNMVLRSDPGIMLDHSHYNRIMNNTFLFTNDEGVLLEFSNYNLVQGNFIDGYGDGDGVTISRLSMENTICNNTIKDPEEYGVLLMTRATGNYIHTNQLLNCSLVMDPNAVIAYDNEVAGNNTVNGKPLIFLRNLDLQGATISPVCGQMILVNVSNGRIKNVSISNATLGMWIFHSRDIEISNCSLSGHIYNGLDIFYSDGISVSNNTFSECHNSVFLEGSAFSEIKDNEMTSCGRGASAKDLFNCSLIGNNISDMTIDGITVWLSEGLIIGDNTISGSNNGIMLLENRWLGLMNEIRNNIILDCTVGI